MVKPLCIAHRGFSGIAPENTSIAFQKALELHPDAVELDVHLSKDGELIVIHDDTVDRTTNGKGKVAELTLSELKSFDAGSWFDKQYQGERIPTLKEALSLMRNKTIVAVELKAAGTAEKAVPLIEQLDMTDQVMIFSFYPEYLKSVKHLNPKIPLLHLFYIQPESKSQVAPLFLIHQTLSAYANMLGINANAVTPQLIDTAHKRGIGIGVYTVNEENDMRTILQLGVDAIVSNYINRLLKVVKNT